MNSFFQFYRKNGHLIWFSIIVLIFLVLGYGKSFNQLYFSNDEWIYMGGVRTDGVFQLINTLSLPDLLLGRGRTLGTLTQNIFYQYFPYNVLPFVYLGFFFHFLNCLLLFLLIRRITKAWLPAWITGILFVSSSSYYQALSWIACLIEVPVSTFFVLLSLHLVLDFMENKRLLTGLFLLCSSYIAFLFKDATVYIFLFPVWLLLISFVRRKKIERVQYAVIFISFCMFMLLLLSRFFSPSMQIAPTVRLGTKASFYVKPLINMGLYPLIGIAQNFVPFRFMTRIAQSFLSSEYDSLLPYIRVESIIAENIIADMLSITISTVIFLVTLYFTYKQKKLARFFQFWTVLYVLQFMPIAFYLTYRGSSYIESRYMYMSAIAISAIVASGIYSFILFTIKRRKFVGVILTILCLLLVTYCLKQTTVTKREVYAGILWQQDTKLLVKQIQTFSFDIPKKPIIYIGGASDFYGYPGQKTPFLLGTGYITMILFFDKGVVPPKLIRDSFLYKFGEEGYREIGSQGFGYFWDKEKLLELYKTNPTLSLDQLIAYEYDDQTKRLIPVTDTLKEYIMANR